VGLSPRGRRLMQRWASMGPRFMPFADVATADLPLRRLLRLSLFQASVGMALVLLVGTLNRVMIVELDVPASIVAVMIALPLVFAPFRALIGYRSDTHRSELGWRRVPFIWRGSLAQFAGFSFMPFALLVLAGKGESHSAPLWLGHVAAAIAFLLVGAGAHTTQTAGLALATDLTPQESHPRVVGLMYVSLLLSMIVSALFFGWVLEDFSAGRLVQVVQGAAILTLVLNGVAVWKQEPRSRLRRDAPAVPDPTFLESWNLFQQGEGALNRLILVGVGTMAFGMADVLLEPFGGQVLGMSVSGTTRLTALFAFGGILGFAWASKVLSRGGDPLRLTRRAAMLGVPAFGLVLAAGPTGLPVLFPVGNFVIGFAAALFGHGTLTATMNRAPREQVGLALGAWGAVQATAAGVAVALSGVIRDVASVLLPARMRVPGFDSGATGYLVVFGLEILLLIVTIGAATRIMASSEGRLPGPARASAPSPDLIV